MGGSQLNSLTALAEEATLGGAGVPAEEAAPLATYPDNVSIAQLLRRLPDRDLTHTELEALAAGIAHQPEEWAQHVAFDADDRVYVSLHRDAHVDVWLLCWTPENDTGWHDHDISSGAITVADGELRRDVSLAGAGQISGTVADQTGRRLDGAAVALRRIADAIPDAEFVEIPDSGHMTTLEKPAEVNAALSGFLKRLG